jgi:hypothetical protein
MTALVFQSRSWWFPAESRRLQVNRPVVDSCESTGRAKVSEVGADMGTETPQ